MNGDGNTIYQTAAYGGSCVVALVQYVFILLCVYIYIAGGGGGGAVVSSALGQQPQSDRLVNFSERSYVISYTYSTVYGRGRELRE